MFRDVRLPVLTDFSGTESPLYALTELGLQYHHKGASDISVGPQKFIFRNHMPHRFWPDVLQRSDEDIKDAASGPSARNCHASETCTLRCGSGCGGGEARGH
jgi:hypothetical protein